jgi:release factor glutamine methyltransferase
MIGNGYRPMVSDAHAAAIRRWHEAAYASMRDSVPTHVTYLGREFAVPEHVFAPAPMSELLGNAVLHEVRPTDRVLDMGTGCGVNAILAAARSTDVVGVDINPYAVRAAIDNAARNGVTGRTRFFRSDVFEAVEGTFDVIIFDPPFRWFAPRDLLESSITDENYQALTRFVTEAGGYLNPGGRILLFFGTSGDLDYLHSLTGRAGFRREALGIQRLTQHGMTVAYFTFRLTRRAAG